MNDSTKNKNSKLIVIILLIASIAIGGYLLLSGGSSEYGAEEISENAPVAEQEQPPIPTPTQSAETSTAPQPAPVIVETKTLNIPSGNPVEIPLSGQVPSPEVQAMMGIRKMGSDDAPIKIVEYSSLTCGHCSAFHKNDLPKIKADYIDTGKVQFIFKEFPLNKPGIDASKILRCMPEEKFVSFQSLLFEEQEKWAYSPEYLNPLKQNAKLAGLSEEQIESCLSNKELEAQILGDMKAASDKYKIQSTPTFIVNNGAKIIVGHQPLAVFEETFKGILEGSLPSNAPIPNTSSAPSSDAIPAPAVEEKKE
jgi:protein-disulfide isomerase